MTLNRSTPPVSKFIDKIDFLQEKTICLKNKIPVHILSGGSQDIIKIDFIFNAGIWFQKKALIANATNNLIKEGTKNYTSKEITEGIDNYGAYLQTNVNYDTATVTLYTLTKHLDKVLPFFKDVICFPSFTENELEIYKNNEIEKFKINLEKVSFIARRQFMKAIFGENNPYGKISKFDDYENLSTSDLKSFYKKNYNLNNCKIIISGKVDTIITDKINHFFGNENLDKNINETLKYQESILKKENIFIEKENALQSAIRIGRIMPNKLHKDYFGLQIFNTILGGYFGSRLMKNIREDKGYTYGIGSGIFSMINGGYFFISTDVRSEISSQALVEIYAEIENLQKNEITLEELNLVKNYMLGQLLKSSDGVFNMAEMFENVNGFGLDYDFYNQYIKAIKKINPKTIKELGLKYFNKSDLTEVVVGKY